MALSGSGRGFTIFHYIVVLHLAIKTLFMFYQQNDVAQKIAEVRKDFEQCLLFEHNQIENANMRKYCKMYFFASVLIK